MADAGVQAEEGDKPARIRRKEMTDHAIELMWQLLNEDGDFPDTLKPEFVRACKKWGLIAAIYNLGFMMGSS